MNSILLWYKIELASRPINIIIMNLFILSANPVKAAQAHADTHVVKMILEACQMLYSAHWISTYPALLENKSAVGISRAQKMLDVPASFVDAPVRKNTSERGYRPVHLHHPCTRWIRASKENYLFACELAIAIGEEYKFRYGKIHMCLEHATWLSNHVPNLPETGLQRFAVAMKDEYKISDDPIECYHHYYRTSKEERGLLKYTRRERPGFL
jgi:hypothetical protein